MNNHTFSAPMLVPNPNNPHELCVKTNVSTNKR